MLYSDCRQSINFKIANSNFSSLTISKVLCLRAILLGIKKLNFYCTFFNPDCYLQLIKSTSKLILTVLS